MSLEELFGKTPEVKINDLIIPLGEGYQFTVPEVAKGTGLKPEKVKKILEAMVDFKVLEKFVLCVMDGRPPEPYNTHKYAIRSGSKMAWATNNLILAIYVDKLKQESIARMKNDDS